MAITFNLTTCVACQFNAELFFSLVFYPGFHEARRNELRLFESIDLESC